MRFVSVRSRVRPAQGAVFFSWFSVSNLLRCLTLSFFGYFFQVFWLFQNPSKKNPFLQIRMAWPLACTHFSHTYNGSHVTHTPHTSSGLFAHSLSANRAIWRKIKVQLSCAGGTLGRTLVGHNKTLHTHMSSSCFQISSGRLR